ncbi:type II toxin-antitoxin system VapB family antitoxin [Subtercola frigoramans]|uniref:Ribbon-helix-helix protein CopG domain-containing protein n=1 Tax=Subtercola frigoramans TaxID=120298 RepID=A0ABS2L489_9MICO|nr:type II toxin-antitoxin system VapB family antitoxin [Subtercola frigoramans]MBM7471829.1 hypothetical protein [Subtercola frigoramans]
MGLNLKDEETVSLVTEVATRLGLTKTGAVRQLAREKLAALDLGRAQRHSQTIGFFEQQIWPRVAGASITKSEIETELGFDEMVDDLATGVAEG